MRNSGYNALANISTQPHVFLYWDPVIGKTYAMRSESPSSDVKMSDND